MRIYLRTVCPEILGECPSAWYELENCSNAFEALLICLKQYGGNDVKYESLDRLIFMLNGKHISSDTMVKDGDQLMVLRPVYGG